MHQHIAHARAALDQAAADLRADAADTLAAAAAAEEDAHTHWMLALSTPAFARRGQTPTTELHAAYQRAEAAHAEAKLRLRQVTDRFETLLPLELLFVSPRDVPPGWTPPDDTVTTATGQIAVVAMVLAEA
jgi:hypothetical protein